MLRVQLVRVIEIHSENRPLHVYILNREQISYFSYKNRKFSIAFPLIISFKRLKILRQQSSDTEIQNISATQSGACSLAILVVSVVWTWKLKRQRAYHPECSVLIVQSCEKVGIVWWKFAITNFVLRWQSSKVDVRYHTPICSSSWVKCEQVNIQLGIVESRHKTLCK